MLGQNKISLPANWKTAGSITVEHAELGVTGKDVATVDGYFTGMTIKLIPPTNGPYAMLLRFRSDGAEDVDDILQMYAARGSDFYSRIAILTTVVGTGDADGDNHFIDTISPSEEDGHYDAEEQNRTDNRTAHYYCRVFGNDRFIILASDLDSTTVYCDVCWLYE